MHWTDILSYATLGFGAAIGFGALISPNWAAGVVRLQADPDPLKPGGYSEFRATYGGLLMMLHLMALIMVWHLPKTQTDILVLAPLAVAWIGAGIGRSMSLILDWEDNRAPGLIPVWIPMEFALGLAIFAPFLQLM